MDAKKSSLDKKLQDLLSQASTVATEIQALEQGPGTPHFDQIELPAHGVDGEGNKLSSQGNGNVLEQSRGSRSDPSNSSSQSER